MVKLVPMDLPVFDAYLERSTADYAEKHIRSGNWNREGALEKARADLQTCSPRTVCRPKTSTSTP